MASLFSKKTDQINLLPEREFSSSITGRVLSWIISTFRIIVIITEILVMIAFLSRFWLDAQNTDLNDDLDLKKSQLAASQDFERLFKDTQKRLQIYASLTKNNMPSSYIALVTQNLPSDISMISFGKSGNSFEIIGETSNERSVQQLVVNLQSTNSFDEVTLADIKSSKLNPGVLSFIIRMVEKGGAKTQ